MGLLNDLRISHKPLAGFIVIGGAWAAFFAQMPVVKAAIGASDAVYGAVVLVASLGALAAMWLAPLADRLAGRWATPVASLIVALGMFTAGSATDLVQFALGMTLASVGSGVVDVLVNVRVSEREEQEGRPLMNLNHAMYSFAYAGSALLTGVLRELEWSPADVFLAFGALVAVLAVIMLEKRSAAMPQADAGAAVRLPSRLIWLGGAIVLLAFLTEASSEGWSALHLERTLGGGPAEGALGPAILGLTMGAGRLAGHLMSSRLPELQLMVAAALTAAAGLFLAGLAPGLMTAYLGFGLTGLGVSVIAPLALAQVGRVVPARNRLAAISRVSVMGYAAFFLGPPLMGFTSEYLGLRAGFALVGGIMFVAALVLVPALGRTVRSLQDAWRG